MTAGFQNMKRVPVWLWPLALLLAALLLPVVAAGDTARLEIPLAQQKSLSFAQAVSRVAIGDPEVADVELLGQRDLLVTARRLGDTSLQVWLEGETARREYLVVVVPAGGLRSVLDEAGVQVRPAGEGLVLAGEAASLPGHATARAVAGRAEAAGVVDQSRMAFRHQVQTDIKIVEISHNKLKDAGFFLAKNTASSTSAISPPGMLSDISGSAGGFSLGSESGFLPSFESFNFVVGRARTGVLGVLSVLEGNGFAYTLAEPSLVTLSGQNASFVVGGEFPIPVRQGSGSEPSTTIEFKEFGIRLFLTPTVLSERQIMLRVAPEVSELDFSTGISSGGVTVPSLRIRRTETSIELGDGESFVISGLVSRETAASVDKVPGLGDIPVLGAFFRSSRLSHHDRELIMVVTPRLVAPLAADAALPPLPGERYRQYAPGFGEFMFHETGEFARSNPAFGFSD